MNIKSIDVTNKLVELSKNHVSFMTPKVDCVSVNGDSTCTLLCRDGQPFNLEDNLKSVLAWIKDTGINANGKFSFKLTAVNPVWSYKGLRLGHVYDAVIKDSIVTLYENHDKIATDVNISLIHYKVEF